MPFKRICICLVLLFCLTVATKGQTFKPAERICGKWETTDKTLKVQVSMEGMAYKVKIIWFSDTDGKPIDSWTDGQNPDPALRSRKILGLSILQDLEYHPNTDSWENGMIYDSKHGKEWSAAAYIDKKGQLRVKGYWHIKLIGKTMTFVRI